MGIVDYLTNDESIDDDEKEILEFGFERIKVLMVSIPIVILAGLLFYEIPKTLVLVLCLLPLRQNAGGYHIDGKYSCAVLSLITLILEILAIKYVVLPPAVAALIIFIDTILIFVLSPVGNKKNVLDEIEMKVYGKRAKEICIMESILFMMFVILNLPKWYMIVVLSESTVGMLLLVEKLQGNGSQGRKVQNV